MDEIRAQLSYDNEFNFSAIQLLQNCLDSGAYNQYGISQIDILLINEDKHSQLELEFIKSNPEPDKKDFINYNEFFIAKNKWILAKKAYIASHIS